MLQWLVWVVFIVMQWFVGQVFGVEINLLMVIEFVVGGEIGGQVVVLNVV